MLERDLVGALEVEDFACLVGRRNVDVQRFQNDADALHLFRAGDSQAARPDPQRVLQADAHVGPHGGANGGQLNLAATGAENRLAELVSEQAVCGAMHVHEVFRVCSDAAQDAEDGLHEHRRLHETAVEEVLEVVQVADVIALELEARAVSVANLQDVLDVAEGVLED